VLTSLYVVVCLQRYFLISFIFSSFVELGECHSCKAIWKNIIGRYQRYSFLVERKVPVSFVISSVLLHKRCPINSDFQPLLSLFYSVVECWESPYLSALKPHELISVIYLPLLINASIESTIDFIYWVVDPERHNLLKQLFSIYLSKLFEVHIKICLIIDNKNYDKLYFHKNIFSCLIKTFKLFHFHKFIMIYCINHCFYYTKCKLQAIFLTNLLFSFKIFHVLSSINKSLLHSSQKAL